MSKQIAVIGCGWLGFPLAKELVASGYRVLGTTTTNEKHRQLADFGIKPVILKINADKLTSGDCTIWESDIFVIAIPPKVAVHGADFHVNQIRMFLNGIPISSRIIYMSSTSVYPSLAGKYDESFSVDLGNTGNPTLHQSEQLILARSKRTIVRCGGLMGEQRISGRYFAGKVVSGEKQPVNYIHQADAIGLIHGVLRKELDGVYNLVSPLHPTRSEVYATNSEKFGFTMPTFKDTGIERIIDGALIVNELGYNFRYPDPRYFHS